jgi:hypothetical protein
MRGSGRRLTGAALALASAMAAGACTSATDPEAEGTPPPSSGSTSPQPSSSPGDLANGAPTPSAAPVASPCTRAERALLRELVSNGALRSRWAREPGGRSVRSSVALRAWTRKAGKVHANRPGCESPSADWLAVVGTARSLRTWRVAEIKRLADAIAAWADRPAENASPAIGRAVDEAVWCLDNEVITISYRVRQRPTATGKDIWLDVTIENQTDDDIAGWRTGTVTVSGVSGDQPPTSTYGGGTGGNYLLGPHETLVWELREDVLGERYHVTEDGHFTHIDIWVSGITGIPPSGVYEEADHGCSYRVMPAAG